MATLVADPFVERSVRAARKALNHDLYDEVWEGVYFMPPYPNDEHQLLVLRLAGLLDQIIGLPGLGQVRPGVNVSDRETDWEHNFRIPDVAVFLEGAGAKNCGTHWVGGPSFAVEILSPGDPARQKLDFYAKIGTREMLIIDRDPWQLELYRLRDGILVEVGRSNLESVEMLSSEVVPLAFTLLAASPRPRIEISHRDAEQRWTI